MFKDIIGEQDKILITGGDGMLGDSFREFVPNAIFISHKKYDLKKREDTLEIFYKYKPFYCIHLAAKVGGLKANMNNGADFFYDNSLINLNVLESAKEYIKSYNIIDKFKLVSILSTCIYPDKNITYPLTEDQIHNGFPNETNYPYAYAKRNLDIQSRSYRKQFGCNFITAIPNNMFGKNDNYSLESSHLIPAIIRKIYEAKKNNEKEVLFWGTGEPKREFTYSKDIAKALLFLLEHYDKEYPINIGNTKEFTIKEIVEYISKMMNYEGNIIFDGNIKMNGQFRKPSSNQKFLDFGWKEEWYTETKIALKEIVEYFKNQYPNLRGIK